MPPFGDIETDRGFTRARWRPPPGPPALPVISRLEPDTGPASTNLVIRVIGTDFSQNSYIFFNGSAQTTTFVSGTQVETSLAINIGGPGQKNVWVYDTGVPGQSNTLLFTVV